MMISEQMIKRIPASNSSIFTGPGTNSYLIGKDDLTLVDPGPKINKHLENLEKLSLSIIISIIVLPLIFFRTLFFNLVEPSLAWITMLVYFIFKLIS